jgi:glycosyltransferase involved in cell wall biosynthesis
MDHPLVSVVIPVYNCERYLAEAIESVLNQKYRPIEIIVVDDGSTDDSAEVANRFDSSVRYFYQARSGAGAARNRGVGLSKGEYLAFLDADDIWIEDKLRLQMGVFKSNPEADFVFGHLQQFISPELDKNQRNKIYCPAEKMPGFSAGAMLIKRESFLRVGAFETNWQIGEFINWYMRAKEKGLISFMLPEVVLKRRLHADNMSIRGRDSRADYVRILKASLDRRRAANREGKIS